MRLLPALPADRQKPAALKARHFPWNLLDEMQTGAFIAPARLIPLGIPSNLP